ncbi:MAG: zinc ABC transporter solute-binding protein [Clostridia bacterium]|nr:zinc ABC transporter solute-binding protein [Clostridia bacterium]
MKKQKPWGALFLLILALPLLAGCGDADSTGMRDHEHPLVTVSIPPERAFAEAVCGNLAHIMTVIPPGSSPETYEPTPLQQETFADANIFFAIGIPVEDNQVLPYLAEKTAVVDLSNEVSAAYTDLTIADGRDPHIWLSPKRAIVMVQAIARKMAQLDPKNKNAYEDNAEVYIAQLQALDQELTDMTAAVDKKDFIVFHPAFAYLAADYGLEMHALEQDGKEATAVHLQEMIDLARAKDIKILFSQAEADTRQAEAFAEEIGGTVVVLDPLSDQYIDNMRSMMQAIIDSLQ